MSMQEGIFPVNAISPDYADNDIAETLKQKKLKGLRASF